MVVRAHGVKTRLGGGGELWMDGSGVMQQSAKTSQDKTSRDKCGYAVRGGGSAGVKNKNKKRKKSRQGKTSRDGGNAAKCKDKSRQDK